MGTGSFPGVKRPGRGVGHPPPSSADVKERIELYLYSTSGPSWAVLGWTLLYCRVTLQSVRDMETLNFECCVFCYRTLKCFWCVLLMNCSTFFCLIVVTHTVMFWNLLKKPRFLEKKLIERKSKICGYFVRLYDTWKYDNILTSGGWVTTCRYAGHITSVFYNNHSLHIIYVGQRNSLWGLGLDWSGLGWNFFLAWCCECGYESSGP